MSDYLNSVIQASGGHSAPTENLDSEEVKAPEGYHFMPDGTLMKDSEHDSNEAALEKDSDDPCWDGYVQVGMKKKNGKRVPNCVPSSATINYLVDSINSEFGETRFVSKENAYEVARKAVDKYDYLPDEELYDAVMWELQNFVGYATSGDSDHSNELSVYSDYLPAGHPAIETTLAASAAWVAGAPDLGERSRDAIVSAFAATEDYLSVTHSTTRLRALISSGSLSIETLKHLKAVVERYPKVD